MYTAKQVEVSQGQYELFTTVEAVDTNDEKVTIKKSIGKYTLDRLTKQKERLQAEIDEIDTKIKAIKEV